MSRVTIQLPSLLGHLVNGSQEVRVEAETLRAALDALVERIPAVGAHLFDETGEFREHVLCFHNGANTRWLDSIDVPVADGDTVIILQAVSGG